MRIIILIGVLLFVAATSQAKQVVSVTAPTGECEYVPFDFTDESWTTSNSYNDLTITSTSIAYDTYNTRYSWVRKDFGAGGVTTPLTIRWKETVSAATNYPYGIGPAFSAVTDSIYTQTQNNGNLWMSTTFHSPTNGLVARLSKVTNGSQAPQATDINYNTTYYYTLTWSPAPAGSNNLGVVSVTTRTGSYTGTIVGTTLRDIESSFVLRYLYAFSVWDNNVGTSTITGIKEDMEMATCLLE